MRAKFTTGTHRRRSSDGGQSLLGRKACACRERNCFHKNSVLCFEALFWLQISGSQYMALKL
jgi:hypothetical protein